MTPYRDEAPPSIARTATRWHFGAEGKTFAFLAVMALVASTALFILGTAAAPIAALVFIGAVLAAERHAHRVSVGDRRITVRSGFIRKRTLRSISVADGGEVRVTSAAGMVNIRGRQQPYVLHLVEVHTPHGSWVIFETRDAKRANAMADFARAAIPPRLRIAPELTDDSAAVAAAEEEELAERQATERA